MKKGIVGLYIFCFVFFLVYMPAITLAGRNTWQITRATNTGASEQGPVIENNNIYYTKDLDIWAYDITSDLSRFILGTDDYEAVAGAFKNNIIYLHYSGSVDEYDIHLFDTITGQDEMIARGAGSQTGGVTDGKWIIYINGYATGDLYAYNIKTKERLFVTSQVSAPQIDNEKVVWYFGKSNGLNGIGAYDLKERAFLDLPEELNVSRVWPEVSKDYVVWAQDNDIWVRSIRTGDTANITNSPAEDGNPTVDGSLVSWTEYAGNERYIWVYDMGSRAPAQRIFGGIYTGQGQTHPTIKDGKISWDWESTNGDVYLAKRSK